MLSSVTVMLGGEEGGGWGEVCGGDLEGSETGGDGDRAHTQVRLYYT